MAGSFRRNGDATFSISIPIQERQLLEQLVPQLRALIEDHDMLIWRLFPNPYPEHEKAADEYADLIGDDHVFAAIAIPAGGPIGIAAGTQTSTPT